WRPPANGARTDGGRPPFSACGSTRSRVELAKASIDAHRLRLRFEEGGREVPNAFQAEAPHPGLVAAEVGVGAVGGRIEGDRLALHLLDQRACGKYSMANRSVVLSVANQKASPRQARLREKARASFSSSASRAGTTSYRR